MRASQLLLLVGILGGLGGCCGDGACPTDGDGEPPPPPPPVASFRVWGGDGQSSQAGTFLPDLISVQGKNAGGSATFTIQSGGGTVGGATSYTEPLSGADGVADAAWQLGPALGEQVVRVTFSGHPNFLEIRAVAHGPAALISPIRGQGQTGAPGTAVGIKPTVRISDIDGRPIPRARVDFVMDGVPWGTRTAETGIAEMPTDWVLGTTAGTYQVTAYYTDRGTYPAILGNPVVFIAAAVPVTPTQLTKAAGDNQTTVPGSPVATRPAVRILDQFGNGVPGLTVTFARGENAGGVTDSVATTDAGGVATVGSWTLGAEGEYHLTATAAGAAMTGSPSTFTATSRPPAGTPASVVIVSGDNQTGEVLTDLPQRLRVRVLDAAGRPVSGVTVSFTPGTGSGSFPPPLGLPPIRTNAAGEAESYPWTLGRAAGGQYVAASIPLGPDIAYPSFNATATPGTVRRLVKVSGDGGTYLTGTSLPAPQLPRAQVLDQYDNPVPGLAVAFALTAGGGSLAGPAAITDPMGVARPAGWVLGSVAGANTVTATATVATGSLTPGTLTFTNAGVLTTPNLLQNASFEAPVTSGLITQFGIWGGDATQSVAPVGFAAQDGLRVLRFIATAAVASTPTTASQLWQQVDVSQYRALIDAGAVGITGRALFNRIGGEASDSLFSVRIYAFSGHRVDFVNRYAAGAWLARGLADLKSDGNLLTWQEGVATMTLPVGTEYVVIELIAFEDVINDGAGTAEFLGHYADRASLVLVRQ